MQASKIRVEVYEADPFEGSCCGPSRVSAESVEEFRGMLIERSETLRRLEERCRGTVEVHRDVVSTRRGLMRYPKHVRNTLSERGWGSLPYIFVEGKLVSAGNFPSYKEFLRLLNPYIEKSETQ